MASQLKVYHTISSRLDQLEIQNGQVIFVEDLHSIYLDMGGQRAKYDGIPLLATEEDRLAYQNPVAGLYYVILTKALWLFDGEEWNQINEQSEPQVIFQQDGTWPDGGQRQNVLYIGDNGIYTYTENGEYNPVSVKQNWVMLD